MAIGTASWSLHFGIFPIRHTHSSSPIRHRFPSRRGSDFYFPRASHRFAYFGSKCSLIDTDVHLDHVTTDEDESRGRGVFGPHCPVPFVKLKTDILETDSLNLLAEATFVDTLLTELPVLSEEEQHALSATPAHPDGLHALYASCIAANVVEQLWDFAWSSAIALIHLSLLPVAVMYFFTKVAIIVGGPLVGKVMDHTKSVCIQLLNHHPGSSSVAICGNDYSCSFCTTYFIAYSASASMVCDIGFSWGY